MYNNLPTKSLLTAASTIFLIFLITNADTEERNHKQAHTGASTTQVRTYITCTRNRRDCQQHRFEN